jgi:proton glutamate symport protein
LVLLAPLAAFGATAALVGGQGFGALAAFLRLFLVVLGGLAIFALGVVPAYLLLTRTAVGRVWRMAQQPVTIGFVTASGAAALPIAMESLVKGGVPRTVAAFVLPLGAVFNLAGSALFVGAAVSFLMQAAGLLPDLPTLLGLFAILFFVTKAIPAIPRASLAIIATTASGVGIPAEMVAAGIGALLAVDALLDMTRTAVNVWGHCAVATSIGGLPRDDPQATASAGRP